MVPGGGGGGGWTLRSLLSGLYVLGALVSGTCLAVSLVTWAHDLRCLPPVTSSFGDPVSVANALGRACDVISYSSGVVCGLCLLLAVLVHCPCGHWRWDLVRQTLTLLICTLSVTCATALTVDFVLWCHTLKDTLGDNSCRQAAITYDSIHDNNTTSMAAYFRKMEIQQVCQWAVVPILLCAVLMLSAVIREGPTSGSTADPACDARPQRLLSCGLSAGRCSITLRGQPLESAPLLLSEAALVKSGSVSGIVHRVNH